MDDGSVQTFVGYRGAAQPGARAGQGGHPLPSRRDRGRGPRPGLVDDLEVRRRRRAVRRRQGRGRLRPQAACRRPTCARSPAASSSTWATTSAPTPTSPPPTSTPTSHTMAWIYDTYQMMHPGENNLPVVTGKPLEHRRLARPPRGDGAGRAVRHPAGARARHRAGARRASPARRVAVQGFGNAGAIAAELFAAAGARIVAVSDSTGGIHAASRARPGGGRRPQGGRPARSPASPAPSRSPTRSCSPCPATS